MKLPAPYTGDLTAEQIAEGMNLAIRNAERLLEDARLLLSAKRHASAVVLAILSIEEVGKHTLLWSHALADDPAKRKRAWKRFRSHTEKNKIWLVPKMFSEQGDRTVDDFGPLLAPDAKHPEILDKLKQASTYVDCINNGKWSLPESEIDEEVATEVVRLASLCLRPVSKIEPREVELWREHVLPAEKLGIDAQRRAWHSWHLALVREGLSQAPLFDLKAFLGVEDA